MCFKWRVPYYVCITKGVREQQGEFTYKRVMTNKQTISGSEETKEGAAKSIYQSGIWQMNMQLVEVERIYREVEDGRG